MEWENCGNIFQWNTWWICSSKISRRGPKYVILLLFQDALNLYTFLTESRILSWNCALSYEDHPSALTSLVFDLFYDWSISEPFPRYFMCFVFVVVVFFSSKFQPQHWCHWHSRCISSLYIIASHQNSIFQLFASVFWRSAYKWQK